MELGQAAAYFNTVALEGWNGSAWVADVAKGNFLTYDRFLGPRTFGHKQRMFLMGNDGSELMPYEAVRIPGGLIYLVMSYNHDIKGTTRYATSFLLQQADFIAEIIEYVTVDAPSGIPGSKTPTVIGTFFTDQERYNSEASREFDDVRYETTVFTLPKSAEPLLTVDHELKVNNIMFEVKEVYPFLSAMQARGLERG